MEEKRFTKISKSIIGILTMIISTSFVTKGLLSQVKIDIWERAYLVHTNIILMAAGVLLLILALFGLWLLTQNNLPQKRISLCKNLTANKVFGIVLALGSFFVLISQNAPADDADHCMKIAEEIMDGIFHSFDAGQYMDTCRQQFGLVLYMCLLSAIGGAYNYILFQMITVLLFAIMCKTVYSYIDKKGGNSKLTFILLLLYLPIWMSVVYVYGNMLGLALGIIALIWQQEFLDTNETKYAIGSAVLIGLSIAFKMFFLIFLIAMIILYIWNFIESKNKKALIFAAACLVSYIVINMCISVTMNAVSGGKVRADGGYSLVGTLVMGVDLSEAQTNPGWYNAYNVDSYYEAEFDKALATQISKEELGNVMGNALEHPFSYMRLMSKKNHTIWNEPTFDIFYRNRIDTESHISTHAKWYNDLLADSGRLHRVVMLYLSCLQLVVYAGVIFYVLTNFKSAKYTELIGLVIFIGGFLFLTIWEGKSEYALCYFVPLLVYSIRGYDILFCKAQKISADLKQKTVDNSERTVSIYTVLFAIEVFTVLAVLIIMPHDDNKLGWNQYLDEHYYISSDDYSFVSKADKSHSLDNVYVKLDPVFGVTWSYVLYDNTARTYFTFQNWDLIDRDSFDRYIAESESSIGIVNGEEAIDRYFDDHWIINRTGGGYVIRWFADQNKVWTYDESLGQIVLANYEEGNANQIWELK